MGFLDRIFDQRRKSSRTSLKRGKKQAAESCVDTFDADLSVEQTREQVVALPLIDELKTLTKLNESLDQTTKEMYELLDKWLASNPSDEEKERVNVQIAAATGLRFVFAAPPKPSPPPPKKKMEMEKEMEEYLESYLLPYRISMSPGGHEMVSVILPPIVKPSVLAQAFCRIVESFNVDEFGHVIVTVPYVDPNDDSI